MSRHMKASFVFIMSTILVLACSGVMGQVVISTDNANPDPSSILDVRSTNMGMLLPRMTTAERDAIQNPAIGLAIFNVTTDCIEIYNHTGWWNLCKLHSVPSGVTANVSSSLLCTGQTISLTGSATGATIWSWTGPNGFTSSLQNPVINNITTSNAGIYTLTASNLAGPAAPVSTPNVYVAQNIPSVPVAAAGSGATQTTINANWNSAGEAYSYLLDVSTNSSFTSYVPGYQNLNVGNVLTSTVTGLICNTPYYYRVRAYNGCGTSASSGTITYSTAACPAFVCGNILTDTRDSKTYATVLIGAQCWMAQNLNIGTRVNGSVEQSNNSTIEKYCYNDNESYCTTYGGMYQWAETVQYLNGATNTSSWSPVPTGNVQGICPSGWHVPTDNEWTTLIDYLGGASSHGGDMKETGTTHWLDPNTGATNSSGFTGLGTSWRYPGGSFYPLSIYGNMWSSTQYTGTLAWERYLYFSSNNLFRSSLEKTYGYGIRCVKD
jgi:uncharacterized protein (TIGR02145 family)